MISVQSGMCIFAVCFTFETSFLFFFFFFLAVVGVSVTCVNTSIITLRELKLRLKKKIIAPCFSVFTIVGSGLKTVYPHLKIFKCKHTYTHLACVVLSHFSHVRLFATLWTVACQAPLSMGFSKQEYCSGLPFPPPGNLPNPEIEPAACVASALQVDSLLLSHQGSPTH